MKIDYPTDLQIPQLRSLWKEAFGDSDAFLDVFFDTAFDAKRCLCITANREITAAAYWFSCEKYAYIYAVATAQAYRGQGYCHRLMDRIHAFLQQQGYTGAIVVPGEENLRRFYADMGYQNFGGIREFTCAAGAPLPMRQLEPAEFAALRRQYLPANSVVQEGENLAFLSRWAEFYTGSDFLLTVSKEGDVRKGLELLGNVHAAPGIVAALGANSLSFRTPGEAPYAMCKSLGGETIPAYFGFAFD